MAAKSITGTESFKLRLQRNEILRGRAMFGIYLAFLGLTFSRWLAGGVVMSSMWVFLPTLLVLTAAATYALCVVKRLRQDLNVGTHTTAPWVTHVSAIELTVPSLLMLITHLWSPRGEVAALSGPVLLLFPLTVLMSVLRLRPWTTLALGLAAAAVHALLTLHTIYVASIQPSQYPVLFSYAVILALIGLAGALVARAARQYLSEAVEETQAAHVAGTKLAAIEQDLEVARKIQSTLLPSTSPMYPGYDIAGMNKPADQTGGDYFDWQVLPDGRLLVTVADVTGHGIGPALIMAVCRAYSRASAPIDGGPGMLLNRLNNLLHADMEPGRFITLATATLSPDGTVEFISAGHGPSLLIQKVTGIVRHFDGDGLPLALYPDQEYGPPHQVRLEVHDILMMITDGVFEWFDRDEQQFGAHRVAELVKSVAHEPAAVITERLYAAVVEYSGGSKQLDDVTIVVIKRTR